jgi:hypothetical protein
LKYEILLIVGIILVLIGIIYLVGGSTDEKAIDCSHVVYTANYTRNLEIMKYCTGGEKEVQ